jgi:hypothetical protein
MPAARVFDSTKKLSGKTIRFAGGVISVNGVTAIASNSATDNSRRTMTMFPALNSVCTPVPNVAPVGGSPAAPLGPHGGNKPMPRGFTPGIYL